MLGESEFSSSNEYWMQTRRPLSCLIYLLPLLVIYEIGIVSVGGGNPDAYRNGADYWMRGWLSSLGLTQAIVLPILVILGLMTWHVAGRYPWRVSMETLVGMLAESLLFAFFLVVVGQVQDLAFQYLSIPRTFSIFGSSTIASAITFVGAGVYEEVLFRLCLLPLCYGFFRLSKLSVRWSVGLAIVSSSLMFSFAHYVGPSADQFSLYGFTFRTGAGVFFAWLFCIRGFGITVGCHAAYDLLVGIVLVERGFFG